MDETLQCDSGASAPAAASAGGGGSSGNGGGSGEAACEETSASGDPSDQARGERNEQQRSQQPGRRCGLGIHHQTTKNNRPQREKGPKPLDCVTGCDRAVKRSEDGRLVFASLCPVHLLLHAKVLQARDAGVPVARLRGPVFGKYRKIEKLPAGSTLVKVENTTAVEIDTFLSCKRRGGSLVSGRKKSGGTIYVITRIPIASRLFRGRRRLHAGVSVPGGHGHKASDKFYNQTAFAIQSTAPVSVPTEQQRSSSGRST